MEQQASKIDLNLKPNYDYPIEYFVNDNRLLKTQITNLTCEINKLGEENFRLNQILVSREGELLINKSLLEHTQKLCSDLNAKFSALQNENLDLRNELLRCIEEKNSIINVKDSLKREKEIVSLEIKDSQNEILNKIKEIKNYQQQIEQLTSDKLNLTNNLVAVKNELTNERFSLERVTNELNQIRIEFLTKEKYFGIERQNFNLAITNMNDLIKEHKENGLLVTKKSDEAIFKMTQEKNNLQNENERQNLKIKENQMNLELKTKKVEELGNVIIELKRHIIQAENEAKILREIITDKENEISNLYKIKTKYDVYKTIERNSDRESNFVLTESNFIMLKDEFRKLSTIKEKIQNELNLARDQCEKFKIEINTLHDIKIKYDTIFLENDKLYKEYNNLKELLEKSEKDTKENKNEIEILNQFVEKLSSQNRELLYEIRLKEPGKYYLSQNLSKEKYEEFIYYNINDLEPRLTELLKKNISLNQELDSLKEIVSQYESHAKEKEEIVKNLEEYVKNLEETNANLKKEFETLRFYSDSHYHLFTLNFSQDKNLFMEKIQELKDNLELANVNYQTVLKEKENVLDNFIKIQKNYEDLNQKNFELKNCVYNKDLELNRYKMEAANYSEIQKNHLGLLDLKDNEIKILKSELSQVKNSHSQNLKEKEEMIKYLSLTLNENNQKLDETNIYFRSQMEKLFNENVSLKKVYEEFTKSIIGGEILELKTTSHNFNKDISSNQLTHEELNKNLETIKTKLLSKDEEIFKLKESKSELQIKLENIISENCSLKYKNEFLESRIKFFKNLVSGTCKEKETTTSLKIKRNPIFKEKKLKVTEISMNEPERLKEYSININEEVDINYEIIEEKVENINNLPENSENIENKFNFNEALSQKYLEAINSIQKLKTENLLLQTKFNELNEINLNLVKNDMNAPYIYLFKKIEELSNQNLKLENENKLLNQAKIKVMNDFAFINLQNDLIKKNEENQINLNKELLEKIKILEINLEEQMKHSLLYANSQIVINEKDAVINSLIETKDELNSKVMALDSILEEKIKFIGNLENQLRTFEENKEKEFKNQTETHNKEMVQSKSNIFKNFYVSFKRSKNLIETFVKLKDILEEKIQRLENENKNYDLSSYLKEFNNIHHANEQEINELKRKISQMALSQSEIVNNLNTEIESLKEKEKSFVNEIKTFKNINQIEGSLDLKNYFGKLLRNMHSSTNIIKFQNDKIKELEHHINKLKENSKNLGEKEKLSVNPIITCEKCKILNLQINALTENNQKLMQRLNEEINHRKEIESSLSRNIIEKDILLNDVQKISGYIKDEYDQLPSKKDSSNLPQSQIEKNKTFSLLINQLRKASKIISLLEKSNKELDREGIKFLQKEK